MRVHCGTEQVSINFMFLMNTESESEDLTAVVLCGCITEADHGY